MPLNFIRFPVFSLGLAVHLSSEQQKGLVIEVLLLLRFLLFVHHLYRIPVSRLTSLKEGTPEQFQPGRPQHRLLQSKEPLKVSER